MEAEYPGIDADQKAYQDERVRNYLATRADPPNASRMGRRKAHYVADRVYSLLTTHLEDSDRTFARTLDHLATDWNCEGVFSLDELTTFARFGAAPLEEQDEIMAAFNSASTPEEQHDVWREQTGSSLTLAERAEQDAERDRSIKLWNDVQAGSVAPLTPATPSKLYEFPLEAGRLKSRFNGPPDPRQYIVNGLLPAGITALLSGHGGVNKTRLLTLLAGCIAAGRPFLGLATSPGAALLILGEDDQAETYRRIGAIAHALEFTQDEREFLNKRLLIFSTSGEDIRLTGSRHGSIVGTGLADRIVERCKEHEAQCGVPIRLVGFDHIGLVSGGDPNDNTDATLYNQQASRIANGTGATVITLAHHRKSSASQDADQHATMGAAANVNTVRLALQLNRMSPAQAKTFGVSEKERADYIKLSIEKANGIRTGDVCWLHSIPSHTFETTVLERIDLAPVKPDADAKLMAAKETIWGLLKEAPGKYSISEFVSRFSTKAGVGREKLRGAVREMIEGDYLALRPPTDSERQGYKLTRQTGEVLIVKKPLPSSEYQDPQGPAFEVKS